MVLRSVSVPLLCLVASSAGAVCQSGTNKSLRSNPLRIVGGAEVQPRQYPFQVSLQDGDFHFCGGSLVAPGWVLTAAHCGNVEWVEVGAHSLSADDDCVERIRVKRTIKHPNYNDDTMENDISLLQLESNSGYAPISPYFHQTAGDDLETVGTLTTVSGWGTLSSGGSSPDVLHAVNVPIVSNEVCNQAYRGDIVDSMVCAGLSKGGKDSCQGDSGGPLFVPYGGTYVQLGVVSFGEGCALPDKYGVYTRVSSYSDFLCTNAGVACRDGEIPSVSSPTPKPIEPSSSNDGTTVDGSLDGDFGSLDGWDENDDDYHDDNDGNNIDHSSFDGGSHDGGDGNTDHGSFDGDFGSLEGGNHDDSDDHNIDHGSFDSGDGWHGNDDDHHGDSGDHSIDHGSFDGDFGSLEGGNHDDSDDHNIDHGSFDSGDGWHINDDDHHGDSDDHNIDPNDDDHQGDSGDHNIDHGSFDSGDTMHGNDGSGDGHWSNSDGYMDGHDAQIWSNWYWMIENAVHDYFGNMDNGDWHGN